MNHLKYIVIFLIILSIALAYSFVYSAKYNVEKPNDLNKEKQVIQIIENPLKNIKSFTITAVGDCTIGWDTKFGKGNRFDTVIEKNNKDYGYFFKLVKSIFEDDDITYANFEGTLTNETTKVEKAFNFKASPDFVKVLKEGNIEVVGLANNHSYDYGTQGLLDTKETLEKNKIDYFGGTEYLIKEVKGLKIGFFGLIDIPGRKYKEIDKAIKYLKDNNCDLIIAAMHWGIEKDYNQSDEQIKEGHYLIDNGVDLVIGTHPHVIQGIEEYDGSVIAHSLGNFCFDDIYTKASGKNPLVTLSENNRHGLILELTIEGGKILKWREQVVYISKGDRLLLVENDEMIERYNHALVNSGADVDAYIQMREELLKKWSDERKANRSLTWYIKRMRPMYLQILRNARKNSELYKENILNFIAND